MATAIGMIVRLYVSVRKGNRSKQASSLAMVRTSLEKPDTAR